MTSEKNKEKRPTYAVTFTIEMPYQNSICPMGSGNAVVDFVAEGKYGDVTGTGTVISVQKNGVAVIEMNGERYKTRNYELLRKAV